MCQPLLHFKGCISDITLVTSIALVYLHICIRRTLLMYLMFTPTDSFSMRIVLIVFLFLSVVGILVATAMLIYEFCLKTEQCNKKKGLDVCVCIYI